MLFELEGGNHETGLNPYSGSGQLGEKVIDWLNYHLLDNLNYCDTLLNVPSSATQFYTNLQCEEFLAGDINGDSIINVSDIIILVSYVLNEEYFSNGDINLDGLLNIQDVIMLLNIIID